MPFDPVILLLGICPKEVIAGRGWETFFLALPTFTSIPSSEK